MNFADVRSQYPQYGDMTDEQLATALHKKFYPDMAFQDFSEKIGFASRPPVDQSVMDANDARARTNLALNTPITQGTALGAMGDAAIQGLRDYRSKALSTYGTDSHAQMLDEMRTSPSAMLTRGVMNTMVVGPGQLAANALGLGGVVNPAIEADRAANQAAAQRAQAVAPEAFQTAGEVAGVAGLPGAKGVFNPATFAGRVGNSALLGTVGAAAQPVYGPDFWGQKQTQAWTGLAAGLVSPFLFEGIAQAISPKLSSEASKLVQAGVRPTPGQMLGGMAKTTEEKVSSWPFIGDIIKSGQKSAIQQFDRAAINEALAPIEVKLPAGKTGQEAIAWTQGKLNDAYGGVLDKIGTFQADAQLLADITKAGQSLPGEADRRTFVNIIRKEFGSRIENGQMPAEDFKGLESMLTSNVKKYMAGDWNSQQMGQALSATKTALRDNLTRQAPQYADALQRVNQAFANFKRVERAAGQIGAKEGVFTPAMLRRSVNVQDISKNKGAFAAGNARMQGLADAADKYLTAEVPNSGTFDRAAVAALLNPKIFAGTVAGTLPAAALYSDFGRGLLAGRQGPAWQALAQGTRQLTPLGALAPVGLDPAALATIPLVGLLGQ